MEFADLDLIKNTFRLQVFSSFSKHVRQYFKSPKLIALMEFPVLFLGAMPKDTPALYSLMNYAGLKLGTWYPMGGFHKIVEGMTRIAQEQGVNIYKNEPVTQLAVQNKRVSRVLANGHSMEVDAVVGSADYNHIEQHLLAEKYRNYTNLDLHAQEIYKNKKWPTKPLFYVCCPSKTDDSVAPDGQEIDANCCGFKR